MVTSHSWSIAWFTGKADTGFKWGIWQAAIQVHVGCIPPTNTTCTWMCSAPNDFESTATQTNIPAFASEIASPPSVYYCLLSFCCSSYRMFDCNIIFLGSNKNIFYFIFVNTFSGPVTHIKQVRVLNNFVLAQKNPTNLLLFRLKAHFKATGTVFIKAKSINRFTLR